MNEPDDTASSDRAIQEMNQATISRMLAETSKLVAETSKLQSEASKFRIETDKLQAESLKFRTESQWYPFAVGAGFTAAVAAITTAVLTYFSRH